MRALDIPRLLNARDLGGLATRDGARTRWRSLVRTDDLVQLDAAGLAALGELGVRTVLDLRWPQETRAQPSPVPRALPGVHYEHISLLGGTEEAWQLRCGEVAKASWKCAVLEHVRAELRQVMRFIAAAPPGPLVFHCVAGKDRTGIVAALLLVLADARPEEVAADYAASTACLREAYLERYAGMGRERVLAAVHCPEEGVHNMLRFLERAGGVRAYLADIGLGPSEIAALRSRLRE